MAIAEDGIVELLLYGFMHHYGVSVLSGNKSLAISFD